MYGRLYTKYQIAISEVDTYTVEKKGTIFSTGKEVIIPSSGETAEDIARASAVVKPGIILGGDLNIVYPKENINTIFLAISLSNGEQQKTLSKSAQGKSVVHVQNSDIKHLKIFFPTINEQERLSFLFSNIDNLITLHQRNIKRQNEKHH